MTANVLTTGWLPSQQDAINFRSAVKVEILNVMMRWVSRKERNIWQTFIGKFIPIIRIINDFVFSLLPFFLLCFIRFSFEITWLQ